MIQKFLKITHIGETQEGKNGSKYIQVTFEPKYMLHDGTPVACALRQGKRNVFGDSVIDGKPVLGDGLFKGITEKTVGVGSLIEGQLARVQTTPYLFEGRDTPTTQWTGVVFGHENPRDYVNSQFKGKKEACAVTEDGTLTAPENLTLEAVTNIGDFVAQEP